MTIRAEKAIQREKEPEERDLSEDKMPPGWEELLMGRLQMHSDTADILKSTLGV